MNSADLYQYATYGVLGFGVLTIAVNSIAAITPSDKDNKVARVLSWVNDKLIAFALPFLRSKMQKPEQPPKSE